MWCENNQFIKFLITFQSRIIHSFETFIEKMQSHLCDCGLWLTDPVLFHHLQVWNELLIGEGLCKNQKHYCEIFNYYQVKRHNSSSYSWKFPLQPTKMDSCQTSWSSRWLVSFWLSQDFCQQHSFNFVRIRSDLFETCENTLMYSRRLPLKIHLVSVRTH